MIVPRKDLKGFQVKDVFGRFLVKFTELHSPSSDLAAT